MNSFEEFRAAMLRRIATVVHVATVRSTDKVKDLEVDDLYFKNIVMSAECLTGRDIPEATVEELSKKIVKSEKTVQEMLETIWNIDREEAIA